MRGKRAYMLIKEGNNGITPADAGKTTSCPRKVAVIEDHPRGCGENARAV